jgi:hypothetical protein
LAQLLVAQVALEDDNLDPNNGQHNIHPFPGEQIELTFLRAKISTEKSKKKDYTAQCVLFTAARYTQERGRKKRSSKDCKLPPAIAPPPPSRQSSDKFWVEMISVTFI